MVTSSKRAYATPSSAAPRAPVPVAGQCWTVPLQETFKHSKAGLTQALWGLLVCTRFCLSPWAFWWVWGLILNAVLPLLPSCWGFSFALGCGVSFSGGIQHSPVDSCSAASFNFGVLVGEDEHMSFFHHLVLVYICTISNSVSVDGVCMTHSFWGLCSLLRDPDLN